VTARASTRLGRKPLLTQLQVARAAFDLVDQQGPAALTMPRLARQLGVGTITLYGYAASKEALIGMLPDLLLADLPDPDPKQPWEAMLETVYLVACQRLIEHRHVTRLVAQSPVFGHAQARLVEGVLSCLEAHGFSAEDAFAVQRTVGTYTLGFALFSLAEREGDSRPREAFAASLASEEFPRTAEVRRLLAVPGDDSQFLTGMRAIIHGFR
jgi:AcrR family transcriptional regulator